jgi:hypothetical protein
LFKENNILLIKAACISGSLPVSDTGRTMNYRERLFRFMVQISSVIGIFRGEAAPLTGVTASRPLISIPRGHEKKHRNLD